MTIAVLGATGGQGGAVAGALLDQGLPVRGVVRDPGGSRARALAARGAEIVMADLANPDTLAYAFQGTTAAFALTTPFEAGLRAEEEQGMAIIEAALRVELPHLVMASVASADRRTGIPHFETKAHTEEVLAASGLPATVVAPTYFFHNVFGELHEIASGVLVLPLDPGTPLQQVSRRDLGRVVAAVIAEPERWIGRRIEVAADAPTPAQMAEAIGHAAGWAVEYRQTPLSSLRVASPDMGAMFAFLAETGFRVDLEALRAEFPRVPWTPFAEWASAQRWSRPLQ
ncbi:NmrA family NAD(P)-binding protein [Streptomyces iconiensis]|uniref:NmrA family NAD(P)-binding protein n=1 Tax=Streptomyces iconiensis TaxID=1384038 RepID=A0ABT6ZWE9_9ACTN|nr:NmrA family NAD(P)-binding protein [Streptomyces iconiensis]MDJ1133396.1 NmrA family NAD(P)-binding protein [Streptomyces iconiensis]